MKILVAGDFCPQQRVASLFGQSDYASVLGGVKPIVISADYAIVNLECPVIHGGELPLEKCGPNLSCSIKGIEALQWVGFDCVTLANNHFFDYGFNGVNNTLQACEEFSIDTVGGGLDIHNASKTLYKQIGNKTLAVINCCENEFSIASASSAGSNPLDPIQQFYAISKARKKADFVLVIVHGGHENYQLPSLRMQETYRFFIDAGADAVVNHHQHCFSGYEFYKDRPIFYGLGNFCFDEGPKSSDLWHIGYFVILDFTDEVNFKIVPYSQCKENGDVKLLSDLNGFSSSLKSLNEIISDAVLLRTSQDKFYDRTVMSCLSMFDPINCHYIKKAQLRGLLPFLYSRKYLIKIFNYINCESHREKLLFSLSHWQNYKKK